MLAPFETVLVQPFFNSINSLSHALSGNYRFISEDGILESGGTTINPVPGERFIGDLSVGGHTLHFTELAGKLLLNY